MPRKYIYQKEILRTHLITYNISFHEMHLPYFKNYSIRQLESTRHNVWLEYKCIPAFYINEVNVLKSNEVCITCIISTLNSS